MEIITNPLFWILMATLCFLFHKPAQKIQAPVITIEAQKQLPAAPEPPKLSREEVVAQDLLSDLKTFKVMVDFEKSVETQFPELLSHPIGNNETVGKVIKKRLWSLKTQIITRRPF